MEHFARDPAVLSSWAKNFRTGAPLPKDLAEDALATRESFPGNISILLLFSIAKTILNFFISRFKFRS